MKNINIGKTLIIKRGEKGITQDELASFMGVSKASVSKWERGQSYPDITFLPQLAAYFDISLDELMGYEPQMTNYEIGKLYEKLSYEFTTKPLGEVLEDCRSIAKKYFSCFPLLLQMGELLLNYGVLSKDDKEKVSIITEAKELFNRVKSLSNNIESRQLALHFEAVCELMLENPEGVIELLRSEVKPFSFHPSIQAMLSKSYKILGNTQEAKGTMEDAILDSIVALFFDMNSYLELYIDDKKHFQETCRRITLMIEIFNWREVYPFATLSFYITAGEGYLTIGDTEKALMMLENYAETATKESLSLRPKEDDFFTLINQRHEASLRELPFGVPDFPCDEQTMKQNIIDAIATNPTFLALIDEPRCKALLERLKAAKITLTK